MAPDATANCFYCGKTWPISRMYAKRDKPAGNRIGFTCQDRGACRERSGADRLRIASNQRLDGMKLVSAAAALHKSP